MLANKRKLELLSERVEILTLMWDLTNKLSYTKDEGLRVELKEALRALGQQSLFCAKKVLELSK